VHSREHFSPNVLCGQVKLFRAVLKLPRKLAEIRQDDWDWRLSKAAVTGD
jgi:hypothetical protein